MNSLIFDGLNLIDKDNGYYVGKPLDGLESPVLSSSVYPQSGEDGVTVAGIYSRERRIIINGMIRANCLENLIPLRQALSSRVLPERDNRSRLQNKTLRIIDADGSDYTIYVQAMGLLMARENPTYSRYQLDLLAEDFRIYSTAESSGTATISVGGSFSIPFSIPFSFEGGVDGSVTITNNGDTTTYPTIKFTGPLTNPRIYNEANDTFVQLNTTIDSGDYITVDTKSKTVVSNIGVNKLSTMTDNSHWPYLDPGQNTFVLTSGSEDDTGSALITFQNAYSSL